MEYLADWTGAEQIDVLNGSWTDRNTLTAFSGHRNANWNFCKLKIKPNKLFFILPCGFVVAAVPSSTNG